MRVAGVGSPPLGQRDEEGWDVGTGMVRMVSGRGFGDFGFPVSGQSIHCELGVLARYFSISQPRQESQRCFPVINMFSVQHAQI